MGIEAIALGALIGLSLGALGAGGSILTVPILVYVMGVPVQNATGTSLAIVGINAAAGALDHQRRGRSLPRTGVAFGIGGLVGAFAGTWLNHQARPEVILALFAVVMPFAAWSLIRRRLATDEQHYVEEYSRAEWLRLICLGVAIGLLTGFFGVGGGFLIVPALVVLMKLPMRLAVGTSLLAIALNALWGVLGYLRFGAFDWTLTALFAMGGLLGVVLGGRLTAFVPERALRHAFALVIVSVAAYTLIRSAAALGAAT